MAMAKSVGKNVARGLTRRGGDKQRAWRQRIADQQRGKESVRAFCRKNRLTEGNRPVKRISGREDGGRWRAMGKRWGSDGVTRPDLNAGR